MCQAVADDFPAAQYHFERSGNFGLSAWEFWSFRVGILVFPLLLGGNSLWMVMPTVEIVVLLLSATFLKQHRQRR